MKQLILLPTLLLGAYLFLTPPSFLAAAPVAATTPTATPAEEAATAVLTETTTLADLQTQLAALQAQVDELTTHHAEPEAADINQVTTAVYLLDTAGLHDLDVRLNEEEVIEAGDSGRVARVVRLLGTVDWPEPLATEVVTLTTVLTDLATALENDDLATAAPLATQVHEVQHDFSHAAEHWLGEMTGQHEEGEEKAADGHK